MPQLVRWDQLNRGDLITCPVSGLAERVQSVSQASPEARVIVHTSRHRHVRVATETVQVNQ